ARELREESHGRRVGLEGGHVDPARAGGPVLLFDVALDEKTKKRLMRSANTTIGKERRANHQNENRKAILGNGDESLTATGHIAARCRMMGNYLWGGMVSTAKSLRRVSDRVINQPNLIIGSGIAAICVALDMASAGNAFSDAVSGLSGSLVGTTATLATFLNYNFWEDIVAIHLSTGAGLMAGGYAVSVLDKRVVRPLIKTGLETKAARPLRQVWNYSANKVSYAYKSVSQKLQKVNQSYGDIITEKSQSYVRQPVSKYDDFDMATAGIPAIACQFKGAAFCKEQECPIKTICFENRDIEFI
ncbi:MAG: hypothetical protein AAF244_04190, partial [Pseudomonadota bacterium]